MFPAKGPAGDMPTWEALREASAVSGDDGSDTDEVDQIRGTPAPCPISRLDRPVYKRKESDWKTESGSAPKRAKHEQSRNIGDNSGKGNRSTETGDSGLDVARPRNSTISSRSVLPSSSTFPPPLPSRVSKESTRIPQPSGQPSSNKQSTLTPHPSVPLAASSSTMKPTPSRVSPQGKDIPSSLDSTLFSNVSAKLAAQPKVIPDSNDVIEICSVASDTPLSQVKESDNTTLSTPLASIQRLKNGKEKEKAPTVTHHEVIEIFDSDEERETQGTPSQSTRTPVRVPQSQTRAPPALITTKGKMAQATPSSLNFFKSVVQDRRKTLPSITGSLSTPAVVASLSSAKKIPNTLSLSKSPTQSKFSPAAMKPTPTPSTSVTKKALTRRSLSGGHLQEISSISNASAETSTHANISDDENINMRDLNVALGMSLISKKDKCKQNVPSNSTRKQRLFARKSIGGRPPRRQIETSEPNGFLGCSPASAIDLTGGTSDEEGVKDVNMPGPSNDEDLSEPPTASDAARALMQPSPVSSTTSAKSVDLALQVAALPDEVLSTESHQALLKDGLSSPFELGSLEASASIPIRSDQVAPPLPSRLLTPNVVMSTNLSVSADSVHATNSSTSLPTEIPQQTTSHSLSKSAPSAAESGPSTKPSSIPKNHLPIDERNTTQGPSSLGPIDVDGLHSRTCSQVVLPQILPNENEMRVYSETEDVAENLLAADESNDAMRGTGEHDAVVGIPSMDEELLVSDDGMLIDREAGYPSERSVHSNSMIKATKSLIRSSSDSGVEVSSEPGLGSNSPISVPSTRRSSRLSLYSNTSGDAHAHHRNLHSMPSSRSTSPDDVGVFKVHSTLGGFPAFRFESYRTDPKNFPKVNYAANLPSSIQDHINNQPEEVRMLSEIREVFEAMILENTADDEREAPPIVIQNDVDEEPTPPWEFWYSNKMWHGKGVPDPDLKNLKGCDCRGACNPKNKACACAQRQCQVIGDIKASEFAYDKNGRLKFPGFPIFECNNTCWCGPECSNRVVQHGRKVQAIIRKTLNKGWGVFNGFKKIPRGTFIGIYAGELLTDEEAHLRGLKYNKAGTTYLFDLDFHHLKEGPEEEWTNLYTVDAYHAGNFTRFLNHSCNPNCRLYPCYINEGDIQKPLLVVFSIRDIEPDEEICFNYQGIYPGDEDDEEEPPEEENDEPKDKIYTKCLCGAKSCRGIMFN